MKTKTHLARAYVPSGLVKHNLDEIRNGWRAETLTAFLRKGSVNEFAFAQERLVRAQHRKQQCATLARDYRKGADLSDPHTARTLARLETDLSEAAADYQFALGQFDIAQEEGTFFASNAA
jgi:hypothetical protein